MLNEEITPNNLINYLNQQEDIKELKYKPKSDYKQNDSFLKRIETLNKKISEYITIIESDDFNNLNLNDSNEKKLHDDIIKELRDKKDELEILKNSIKNYDEMKEKHAKKINKMNYENQLNIFKDNYEIYKKMKNEEEIQDVFKYMYFIYDNLNIDEKDNEKDILDKFIYLYNKNTNNIHYKKSLWNDIFTIV